MKKTIMSFEDACEALGLDATKLPDVSMLPEADQKAVVAHYKLVVISRALNEGWTPNWADDNERKYFPYFEVEKKEGSGSGFGLSYLVFDYWRTHTHVGSRLCFKNSEVAEFACTKFKDLYEESFLIG